MSNRPEFVSLPAAASVKIRNRLTAGGTPHGSALYTPQHRDAVDNDSTLDVPFLDVTVGPFEPQVPAIATTLTSGG